MTETFSLNSLGAMRWFQLDSNTPNDPKIRSILKKFGNHGFGMLIRLWCFVAAHGTRKAGYSLDSSGKPIDVEILAEATGASNEQFHALMRECVRNGLVRKLWWKRKKVISLPAMSRRADTYTKRGVRTLFEQSSKSVRHDNTSTRQDKKNPPTPLVKGGARLTRRELAHAQEVRTRVYGGCPHEPRCPNYDACVRAIALDRQQKAALP